jgi:hypothetical protein
VNSNAATDLFADFNPDIATDGQGHCGRLVRRLRRPVQTPRSCAHEQWRNLDRRGALNTDAATDDGSDQSPRIVTDGKGT